MVDATIVERPLVDRGEISLMRLRPLTDRPRLLRSSDSHKSGDVQMGNDSVIGDDTTSTKFALSW